MSAAWAAVILYFAVSYNVHMVGSSTNDTFADAFGPPSMPGGARNATLPSQGERSPR